MEWNLTLLSGLTVLQNNYFRVSLVVKCGHVTVTEYTHLPHQEITKATTDMGHVRLSMCCYVNPFMPTAAPQQTMFYPLFPAEETEVQTPKFTQPKRNKARILPRQAALLSLWVLSPQMSVGMAVAGMGFKTRGHVLWLPARSLAWLRGPLSMEGSRRAQWTKSTWNPLAKRSLLDKPPVSQCLHL